MEASGSKKDLRFFSKAVIVIIIAVSIFFIASLKHKENLKKENIEKMSFKIKEIIPGKMISLDILIPDRNLIGSSQVDIQLNKGLQKVDEKYHINNGFSKTQGFFTEGAYGNHRLYFICFSKISRCIPADIKLF